MLKFLSYFLYRSKLPLNFRNTHQPFVQRITFLPLKLVTTHNFPTVKKKIKLNRTYRNCLFHFSYARFKKFKPMLFLGWSIWWLEMKKLIQLIKFRKFLKVFKISTKIFVVENQRNESCLADIFGEKIWKFRALARWLRKIYRLLWMRILSELTSIL